MARKPAKKTTRTPARAPRSTEAAEHSRVQSELAALESEASPEQVEAASQAAVPETAQQFPSGRPRGGGIHQGLVSYPGDDGSVAGALTQFPDLAGKLLSTPNTIQKPTPNHRVFHSKYEHHLMQITMPLPIFDPLFGKRIDQKPRRIEFQARPELGVGEFITDDPDDILFIEGGIGEKDGKQIQIPPCKGYGTVVWDAEAKQSAEARIFVRNLKTQLAANPKLMGVLRQEVPEEDFAFLDMLVQNKVKGSGAGA